jgi:hypothetical protein
MTTPNSRTASFVAAALVVWLVLTTLLLAFFAGRASAQPGCTEWVNPVPGTSETTAPGDYASFVLHLEDGTSVEVGPVVLGQDITADQPIVGATKCVSAPEPTPTPEPTPEPRPPVTVPSAVPVCEPRWHAEVTFPAVDRFAYLVDGQDLSGQVVVLPNTTWVTITLDGEPVRTWEVTGAPAESCGRPDPTPTPEPEPTPTPEPSPTPTVIVPPPPTPDVCYEDEPCWDCTTHGNGICGPDEPPTACEMPDCLPETGGSDLEARWGLLLIASGASLLFGSWVLNADRRTVRRYMKGGR